MSTLHKIAEANCHTHMVMLSSAAYAVAPSDVYKFDELRSNAANRRTTERYTASKLANLHYARALAEREKTVRIVPVPPGMVATNLHNSSTGIFLWPFLYAAIWLAATVEWSKAPFLKSSQLSDPKRSTGQYYGPIWKAETGSRLSRDHDLQERLFRWIQGELSSHAETIM
ncbi:uncharacterized protein AlacWU_08513 [Aspergillus niger]|uniref:uncharacterized protein n=1 Tax=Aspergillus lacticoffeatus (strain CBS 101883) TaxID=1450533 RepID=UPI000D8057AC|nr:uncharacterized protein BO96DRAFT_484502 [Aspergillus niger CBS 101883]PYH52718.1 hypothetical protein BO96DRAFT_484502 [Aspergillus niger CBS 101883]GJP95614.1 uncharacterized protein AlacWU_08513 [Aspergillus niger]